MRTKFIALALLIAAGSAYAYDHPKLGAGSDNSVTVFIDYLDEDNRVLEMLTSFARQGPEEIVVTVYQFPQPKLPGRENSALTAIAAVCAQLEGRYWEFQDALLKRVEAVRKDWHVISEAATAAGLTSDEFKGCFERLTAKTEVREDIAAARAAGIRASSEFTVNGVRPNDAERKRSIEGWTLEFQEQKKGELVIKPVAPEPASPQPPPAQPPSAIPPSPEGFEGHMRRFKEFGYCLVLHPTKSFLAETSEGAHAHTVQSGSSIIILHCEP